MRKFVVTLMASLLSCSAAFAFFPEATDSSLEIGVGYRQDKLSWKTSNEFDSYGDSYDDVPLRLSSHLKWKNLRIWQIQASGKYVTCDNLYLRASGDYGWITHGKNTDSDFVSFNQDYGYSDSESLEFSHSHSKARGHVYDAKIAVGYQFQLCDNSFSVAPLVGYSWHGQHIHDRNLHQGYDYDYDSYTSGRNHSKYHTRWNGPFVGFDFDYRFGCCCEWDIFGGYEFHWAQYHAKGDWNLRADLFDGFRHRAKNAYGHVLDIGVKWDFCECWTLSVKGEFQWWWAHRGHDRAKIFEASFGQAETDCFLTIPLRDIKWESAAVSLNLGMVF